VEQLLGIGLIFGILFGFANDWLTRLCLERVLRKELAVVGSLVQWVTIGFLVAKYAALVLTAYAALSRLHLSPLGFALGVLAYQLYRLARLILWPRVNIDRRYIS